MVELRDQFTQKVADQSKWDASESMIEELAVLSHCIMHHFLSEAPGKIKEVLKAWKAKLLRQKDEPKPEKKEKKPKKEKKVKEKKADEVVND